MKSNHEWKEWGKVDPLYAVASWKGRDKGGDNPWTDEEFYALGQSDWEDFFAQWKQYGCDTRHCVEIGCGAGRLTRCIAKTFDHVTALDISEDQISYARSRIDCKNITFRVTDGVGFPSISDPVTAVFSAHVFQHFDSLSDADQVFRQLHRAMSVGGSFMIHLPIYSLPESPLQGALRTLISAYKHVGTLKAEINRMRSKLIMRGLPYERSWLAEHLNAIGFRDLEFRTFQARSNQSWHDFVFGRSLR
jgi:cyclopropane fatty-acyl-phospholipid synthase-like methyltransferase